MHISGDIEEIEPLIIRSGETVKWIRDLSDHYPADDGWTLTYTILDKTNRYTTSGTANAKKFDMVVSATTSATFAVGNYRMVGRVSKSGEVFEVYNGKLEVKPDLTVAVDFRTHVKKVLDAIEAVLEGTASKEQASYSIAGRTLSRRSIADLLMLRDRYKNEYLAEVRAEKIASGQDVGKKILTRFVSP